MTGTTRLTVLLVRHGQSTWNAERRLQGQTPHVPLTELGHTQAVEAARALAPLQPGALISSDLLRAVQTAEHCARSTGLPFTTTPALREQGYGVLEGWASADAARVARWWDPEWAADGGESVLALQARVRDLLRALCAEPPADVVALVTHGDTIRAALAVAGTTGPTGMPSVVPANGSILTLVLDRSP